MSAVKTAGKKVKALLKFPVEGVRSRLMKEATMFMLRLLRGRLSISDIEAHLVKPIEHSKLVTLHRAAFDGSASIPGSISECHRVSL